MVETQAAPKPAKGPEVVEAKKERARSLSYPAFSLSEALAKAKVLWDRENANWTPVSVASEHWGFSAKSSSGIRAVAALSHYGLIEDSGAKESRRIRLSPRARTILLAPPERKPDQDRAIRDAALTPKLYHAIWKKYGGKLPSNNVLTFDLQNEGGINPDVIKEFIKDFRATVEFAKLTESPTLGSEEGEDGALPPEEREEEGRNLQKPKGKVAPMPETQRAEGQAMDFPIPLLSGGFATLRLPVPLSKAEYTHFQKFLTAMLTGMEQAVTREIPKPEDDPNGKL